MKFSLIGLSQFPASQQVSSQEGVMEYLQHKPPATLQQHVLINKSQEKNTGVKVLFSLVVWNCNYYRTKHILHIYKPPPLGLLFNIPSTPIHFAFFLMCLLCFSDVSYFGWMLQVIKEQEHFFPLQWHVRHLTSLFLGRIFAIKTNLSWRNLEFFGRVKRLSFYVILRYFPLYLLFATRYSREETVALFIAHKP